MLGESTTCGGTGTNNEDYNGVDRTCLTGGDIVLSPSGAQASTLASEIPAWNSWLEDLPGMPKFTIGANGVPVTIPGSADAYCGETTVGDSGRVGEVIIYADVGENCNTKKTGTLSAVIRHELAHVLGWNKSHGGASARTSVTEDCVTFLPSKDSVAVMSENVCLHDVEALFRARASGSGWAHSGAYFTSPILWTTNAPDNTNIPASSSAQIAMTQFVPLPGTAVSRSHSHLDWVESTSLFSVDGSGNVTTGSLLGSAKLFLKADASPPSGYLIWTPFKDNGDSVTVTVVSSGPFLVDSLIADQQPVIYGGMRTFTMFTSNQPSGSVSSQWWVDDPRTPGVYPDTIFTKSGLQASFLVDADYFGLEIFVRAYVGGVGSGVDSSGFFFPVCGSQDAFAECPEDQ